MQQKFITDFWSWKIWIGFLFMFIYLCIFVYGFYLGCLVVIECMISWSDMNKDAKNLLEKNLNQKNVMDFWMAHFGPYFRKSIS
jgi:uncharacterized membrane protein